MPPPNNCVAVICSGANQGTVCGKRAGNDNTRCRVHHNSFENKGPHTTARDELKAVHAKEIYTITSDPAFTDHQKIAIVEAALRVHEEQRIQLYREQRDHIRIHGDPDAPAKARRDQARRRRAEQFNANMAHHMAQVQHIGAAVRIAPAVARVPPVRELAAFANDNQNVHTTHAVKQTTDIIKKILEIKVPVRYQWNKRECSKTPGQIIMQCRLTPTAAWQMTAKYCQPETIYEMGEGIYGRVLDCVWQFILASPDKDDLVKIVKTEMEDNIGMCAQGNLSRLCNILSGYLDDVVIRESPAEIMGRLISGILETADLTERARKITEALIESKMPGEKWREWAEPAFDEAIVIAGGRVQILV